MSFYSLQNGEQANVSNTDWDIAFACAGFGYTVRVNTTKGNELYAYPNGDNTSWTTVDTSGMSAWSQLYDSDTSWEFGAFSDNISPTNGNDVGWGIYNPATHDIYGDSLFVLKLSNGDTKKIEIEKLVSGKFHFRYANIDGSSLVDTVFDKTQYVGRNFVYYSILTGGTMNKEPLLADWDILFTQYSAAIAPNFYYPVTGVLHNMTVAVAEATQLVSASSETNYQAYTMDSKINTIGYDWKSFDMPSNTYKVKDSLAYFVKTRSGTVWRLVFTAFEGGATGKIVFQKEKLANPVGINEATKKTNFALYPNPANDIVHILLDTKETGKCTIELFDMSGKLIQSATVRNEGFTDYQLNVNNLPAGNYTVRLSSASLNIAESSLLSVK